MVDAEYCISIEHKGVIFASRATNTEHRGPTKCASDAQNENDSILNLPSQRWKTPLNAGVNNWKEITKGVWRTSHTPPSGFTECALVHGMDNDDDGKMNFRFQREINCRIIINISPQRIFRFLYGVLWGCVERNDWKHRNTARGAFDRWICRKVRDRNLNRYTMRIVLHHQKFIKHNPEWHTAATAAADIARLHFPLRTQLIPSYFRRGGRDLFSENRISNTRE